jgi:hypothetical protein
MTEEPEQNCKNCKQSIGKYGCACGKQIEEPKHNCRYSKAMNQSNPRLCVDCGKEESKQDYNGVHLRHCYQGEYEDGCKYGEDDCPAKPKEEPKPIHQQIIDIVGGEDRFRKIAGIKPKQEKLKQEELEEAARDYIKGDDLSTFSQRAFFIAGAKWQSQRTYSEAIEFAEWIRIKDFQTTSKDNWIGLDMEYYTTQELYEQFKKK